MLQINKYTVIGRLLANAIKEEIKIQVREECRINELKRIHKKPQYVRKHKLQQQIKQLQKMAILKQNRTSMQILISTMD